MTSATIKLTCRPDGKFDFWSEYESGYRCEWPATVAMFKNVMTRLRQDVIPLDETEIDRLETRISKLEKDMSLFKRFVSKKPRKRKEGCPVKPDDWNPDKGTAHSGW